MLSRPDCVPDDVVHGELDELRSLLAPALALSADVRQAPLDVGDLQAPQLVFNIEMLRDQGFDPLADRGTIGFRCRPIGTLLCPCIGFEPEHFTDKLRTDAVAPV